MKKITNAMVVILLVCGIITPICAQEDEAPKTQMLAIHADHVLPAKAAEYEAATKALKDVLEKYEIKDVSYRTLTQSNGNYLYVDYIDNFAELDKNLFGTLKEKMPEADWIAMWKKFDGCYYEHEDFIARYHPDLSYHAEELTEEMKYRMWDFMYFEEKDWDNVMAMAKKWKELYESKKAGGGYTIYTNGFGMEGPVIVVHSWAKSEADHVAIDSKDNELLGDDAGKLWQETVKYIYKQEKITGRSRADLSYIPTQE